MRRAYRLLLRLYPLEYQTEFADEMLAVFTRVAEERRTQGGIAYARFVASECAGLVSGALTARPSRFVRVIPVLGGITLAAAMQAGFYTASLKILRGTVAVVERNAMPLAEQRAAAITLGVLTVVTFLCLLPIFFLVSIQLNRRRR